MLNDCIQPIQKWRYHVIPVLIKGIYLVGMPTTAWFLVIALEKNVFQPVTNFDDKVSDWQCIALLSNNIVVA